MSGKKQAAPVSIRHVPAKALRGARDYMLGEAEQCDDRRLPDGTVEPGICPEQKPAFLALAWICERELARRRREGRRR